MCRVNMRTDGRICVKKKGLDHRPIGIKDFPYGKSVLVSSWVGNAKSFEDYRHSGVRCLYRPFIIYFI